MKNWGKLEKVKKMKNWGKLGKDEKLRKLENGVFALSW